MFIRPWLEALKSRWMPGKRRNTQRLHARPVESRVETLEDKTVLSAFDLVTVIPNQGVFLTDGSTVNEAPGELTLRFSPGQTIDAASLGAISVVRAGLDGVFDNPTTPIVESIDDVTAPIGFIGIGDNPNEVIVRFASTLPDDKYQIRIQATGADALRSTGSNSQPFNDGVDKAFNFELDLGAQVDAVVPQPVIRSQVFTVANSGVLQNGDTLVVTNGPYTTVLEFNSVAGNVQFGHVFVSRTGGDAAVAQNIANAINGLGSPASVALSASATSQTVTITGSVYEPNVTFGNPVLNVLSATSVTDGDVLSLSLGTDKLNFEFNDTDVNGLVTPGYSPITFSRSTTTQTTMVAAIVAAINNPLVNATQNIHASLIGTSIVLTGTTGTPSLTLRAANGNAFSQSNASEALAKTLIQVGNVSNLVDGDTMTLTLNGQTLTFEFNNTDVNNLITPGRIRVNFSHTSVTAASLTAAINAAIINTTNNPTQAIHSTIIGTSVVILGTTGTPGAAWTTTNTGVFSQDFGSLTQATNKVVVYFNQDQLSAAIAQDPTYYRLVDATTGMVQLPTSVNYQYNAQTGLSAAVLTFSAPLPTSTYNLKVGVSSEPNSTTTDATRVGSVFQSKDYVVNEFLGDGTGSSSDSSDADVYQFTTVSSGTVTFTLNSSATLDGVIEFLDAGGNTVSSMNATGTGGTETLTTGILGAGTFYVRVTSSGGTTGGYKLTISAVEAVAGSDDNSSFGLATNLGVLGSSGLLLSAQIQNQAALGILMPPLPGGSDEPGHRDLPLGPFPQSVEPGHGIGGGETPVAPDAIAVITYNFPDQYGTVFGAPVFNQITPEQKIMARQIFEIYSYYTGVQFREISSTVQGAASMGIVTGDIRAIAPSLDPQAAGGIANGSLAIMNGSQVGNDSTYGSGWMGTAFHEIGHNLGLGHSYDVPSVQGAGVDSEGVYPGDNDLIHLLRLDRDDASDIDLYKFNVTQPGTLSAQTIAERLASTSNLNTLLTLYKESPTGVRTIIARNDDFYSNDSGIDIDLDVGTYYIGVTSTGNNNYDPTISNSGNGGTSDGLYNLKMSFTPTQVPAGGLRDTTGQLLDGNHDGQAGGEYNFSFVATDAAHTKIVDKLAPAGGTGSLAAPYQTVSAALSASAPGDVVRIVGNGGADRDASTIADNSPYNIGLDYVSNLPLSDGSTFSVPQGVTVMIEAASLFKMHGQTVDVGTSSLGIDRSHGALQVLGTPVNNVSFTSWRDDSRGSVDDGTNGAPAPADWGGLVFRQDSDSAIQGVFLNYVGHATIQYGGGQVSVDGGPLRVYNAIDMETSRPTIVNNILMNNADAAMSANPNSFKADDGRIGPDIHGNLLTNNSTNGLFIRIQTALGSPAETLDVIARFDDTDITHVITQNLIINGQPGGSVATNGAAPQVARLSGRLMIDPGTIVKLSGARIETGLGNSNLIAEGTAENPIHFTSQQDDRYGAGGTFDVKNDGSTAPSPGNWSGFFMWPTSTASFDNVTVTYAGGVSEVAGNSASFNPMEIFQADVRVANSVFEDNLGGGTGNDRAGRGGSDTSVIYVRGAQPQIINNIFRDNTGNVISINANSMQAVVMPDLGRSTGPIDRFDSFDDNYGPLVRLNKYENNSINGMNIRAEELTIESVWDDIDIAHVLRGTVTSSEFHTYGGLRLQSSTTGSLVVKLLGPTAGFSATGDPLEISDRIGGTVQVIGQPGFPVILTSLKDDSVSTGFLPNGFPLFDTNNDGPSTGSPGDWNSVRFDQYSNDRNVAEILETEPPLTLGNDLNSTVNNPQPLGNLAPNQDSGDENRRLGMTVTGYISPDSPGDVDVYSFTANAGTEVWIDLDRTSDRLDAMVELLDSSGTVVARSLNSQAESASTAATNAWLAGYASDVVGANRPAGTVGNSNLNTLVKDPTLGGDFYTSNFHDAGFRIVLPGGAGQTNTYFVRVRSQPIAGQEQAPIPQGGNGLTSGTYQLQIRLRQTDEQPGSTVRFADIRYATNGVELVGLPAHSPLMGESAEQSADNSAPAGSQSLGPFLQTDRNTLSVQGNLDSNSDVDFYTFTVDYSQVQVIGGLSSGGKFFPTMFDIDWADGLTRPDTIIAVYNSAGDLIYMGRDSDTADDQPAPGQGQDLDDLSRGSLGKLDPSIGTVDLSAGVQGLSETGGVNPNPPPSGLTTYYVAVMSNGMLPTPLTANFNINASASTQLVRLEPINSIKRIVEDHIGFQGYTSNSLLGGGPVMPTGGAMFSNITSAVSLQANVKPWTLEDVTLYVSTSGGVVTVDPFNGKSDYTVLTGQQGLNDLDMRSDGVLYGYRDNIGGGVSEGIAYQINTGLGIAANAFSSAGDNIPQFDPNTSPADPNQNSTNSVDAIAWHRTDVAQYQDNTALYYSVRSFDPVKLISTSKLYLSRAGGDASPAQNTPFGFHGYIEGTNVSGFTTGMQWLNGNLYGVSSNGQFYTINPNNGAATFISDLGFSFTGLADAPQNVQGGMYSDMLFAVTSGGQMVAINSATGTLATVFDTNNDGVANSSVLTIPGASGATGLAFSPIDYNLWHPTEFHGDDAGHGINQAPDKSRLPGTEDVSIPGRLLNTESAGGTSFYFGLEEWTNSPATSRTYYTYSTNGQLGELAPNGVNTQRDLTASGLAIGNNYNVPGGAYGSLITNSFSLDGYNATDKPTLYFNYWLDTQDANSKGTSMRDSARVFVSADNGATWTLAATNNSVLSTPLFQDSAELPSYLSTSRGASDRPNQEMQELFDTDSWRQARIDLADYAGVSTLKLRFDFSTAGVNDDPGTAGYQNLTGDDNGNFNANLGNSRADNNDHVGFFIDDIIVGLASRGEMVTASAGQGSGITNLESNPFGTQLTKNPDPAGPKQLLNGGYQLEIRRGTEYAVLPDGALPQTVVVPSSLLDVNDRQTNGQTVFIGTSVADGNTVTVYDGLITKVFEFNSVGGVSGTNIAVAIGANKGATAGNLATAITTAFAGKNSVIAKAVGPSVNSDRVDIFGAVSVSEIGNTTVSSYQRLGDDNLERQQGQVIIENNTILYSSNDGILVDDNDRFGVVPHPGAVLNTPVQNTSRLVTGLYIQNNVIARSEVNGIEITGDPNANLGPAVVPFVKVVNNTIYGDDITAAGPTDADIIFIVDDTLSMESAINLLISQLLTFDTNMQAANINAHYGVVTMPALAAAGGNGDDPRQIQDITDFATLTAPNSPLNKIKIVGLPQFERGSRAIREALNDFDPTTTFNYTPNARKVVILLTTEDDDSPNDHAAAVNDLVTNNALFYGIVNTTQPGAGTTKDDYTPIAQATGGLLFEFNDFLTNTGPFFQSFTATLTGAIGASMKGTGINVTNSASPTLMNNVLVNLVTGIHIDQSSGATSPEVEANLYQGNGDDSILDTAGGPVSFRGNNALFGADTAGRALFVNAPANNFYPAPNSPIVDSARSTFNDRGTYTAVTSPLSIPPSPIIAPLTDRFGQLRVDDGDQPGPPNQPGLGQNPFQDRGAIESADFNGGVVIPIVPQDNDGAGVDIDPAMTTIWIDSSNPVDPFNILTQLKLQLIDSGIGIDDTTVAADDFVLLRNGTPLIEGQDYFFTYNQNTNECIFTSVATFPLDSRYQIVVNGSGIRDLAGNILQNNHAAPIDPPNPNLTAPFDSSLLYFTYVVTDGDNDAPLTTAPSAVSMNEDTTFTFDSSNPITISDPDAFLAVDGDPNLGPEGGRIDVQVYVPDGLGTITSGSTVDLLANGGSFSGTGTASDPFVISGRIVDINLALANLKYAPPSNYPPNAPQVVPLTIVGEDLGKFGPPAPGTTIPKTSTKVVNITVNPVNDPPTLNLLPPLGVLEDSGMTTVNLSGITAGGGETQALTVSVSSSDPALFPPGSMVVNYTSPNPTGSINFTPAANRFGTANISVSVRDAGLDGIAGNSDDLTFTRTFALTVNPVNDIPGFVAVGNQSVLEDSGATVVNITGITAGPFETQNLTFTAVSSDPSIVPNPVVTYVQGSSVGTLSFTPAANKSGSVTITLTVKDDGGTSSGGVDTFFQTFTIDVTAVNDAPTLDVLPNATISEDAGQQTVNLSGITAGAPDEAGQTLTITATSNNQALVPNGSIAVNYGGGTTGTLNYTALANQFGTAVITVTVTDNGGTANGGSNTISRSFTVTVNSVNDAPTLNSIPNPAAIDEDAGAQTINLTGISSGPPNEASQSLVVTAVSSNPGLIPDPVVTYTSPNATGSLSYTPVANASGTATITVTVTDNGGTANGGVNVVTRTFTVVVNAVNDLPTLDPIPNPAAILEDTGAQTINLSGITAGPLETQDLQVTATSNNSLLIPNANITVSYVNGSPTGSVTYTPAADQNGNATITVTVRDAGLNGLLGDGDDGLTSQTFNVVVTAVNDAPTLNPISDLTIPEDSPTQTVNLSGITVGPANEAGQILTVTAVSSNTALIPNGSIVVNYTSANPTGTLSFTPIADANGTATITVTITDNAGTANGGVNTIVRTFVVTVSPVPDAPTNILLSNNAVFENRPVGTQVGTLSSVDVDLPADSFTYSIVGGTGLGVFQISGNQLQTAQSLDFETLNNYSLTIRSTDQFGLTKDKNFTVQVLNLNDPPTLNVIADQSFNEDSGVHVINLSGISQGFGESGSMTVTATSDNPTLFANPIPVTYSTPSATGSLNLTPLPNQNGTATITVTVMDNGGTANGGVNIFTRTFLVTVVPVNDAPTNVVLSNDTIPEIPAGTPLPANVLVGQFTSTDPDAGDTFQYQLVTGTGSTDNARFVIINDQLFAQGPLDFDMQADYSVRVRTTDNSGTGLSFEKVLTIHTTNVNEPATSIGTAPNSISGIPNSIPENLPANSVVGTLVAGDPDAGETNTFALVSGAGATDNNLFQIVNGQLVSLTTFNYEAKNSYSVRLRVTDSHGLTFETPVVISITNVNEQPTNIAISNSTLVENTPVGTPVGDLSTTDIDVGDLFTYTLVSGTGSTDNAKFSISGNQLVVAQTPNFEDNAGHFYTVRVRSTDLGGLTVEKVFTITITDVNEAPTALSLSSTSINENQPVGTTVGTFNTSDQDAGETFTYTLVSGVGSTDNASFTISNGELKTAAVFDFETKASYSVRVRVTDSASHSLEKAFTITVNDTLDAPVITLADPPLTTQGHKAVVIDPAATITDIDSPNFDGGKLVVAIQSGEQTGDTLSIRKDKSSGLMLKAVKGRSVLRLGTQDIATISGGTKGIPLTIQFGGGITRDTFELVMRNITFRGKPFAAPRVIKMQAFDETGLGSNIETRNVNVQ